ncbi:MAG TPA: helix-turn-helix domain-containing protein, partial [Saprospiraceae bacterium]|nr:helix-turn-helix domain-containing protein [Saprospiraceae bacterium]
RVGASKVERTDVRVIAATNVDLQERVRKGKFREDLFYRLNTVPIRVPALYERREDIPVLFRKFATDFAERYRMQPVRLDERADLVFENYRWPGNIRELKNVAEQLSVLSEERLITAEALQQIMPQMFARNLPMRVDQGAGHGHGNQEFQEREILYKVLFEMKSDLNDLKSLIYELVRSNNLRMPELGNFRQIQPSFPSGLTTTRDNFDVVSEKPSFFTEEEPAGRVTPIIIDPSRNGANFDKSEVEDAPLAMDEIEKEAIRKALKKYNGRRKEAAEELKISERTLYRKIKEYNLQ